MTLDLADVRPSLWSFATITIIAVVGIVLLKWANARWKFPLGIGDIVNAV